MDYNILRLLGSDCQTSDINRQQDIFYALKGIGNMGRPSKAVPIILNCIRNSKHTNMSVAAIQSLRRMTISEEVREVLLEILTDKNEELEKRIEIFLILMQAPTEDEIILARDIVNDEKDSGQMRSFVSSYLIDAANSKDPSKKT